MMDLSALEKRAYLENSSGKEIQLLKSLVMELADDIIYVKEPYVMSTFQVKVCYAEVKRLAENKDHYYIIVDTTEIERPGAAVRAELKNWFAHNDYKIDSLILIVGNNILVKLSLRMIINGMIRIPFTSCATIEDALKLIEEFKLKNGNNLRKMNS